MITDIGSLCSQLISLKQQEAVFATSINNTLRGWKCQICRPNIDRTNCIVAHPTKMWVGNGVHSPHPSAVPCNEKHETRLDIDVLERCTVSRFTDEL